MRDGRKFDYKVQVFGSEDGGITRSGVAKRCALEAAQIEDNNVYRECLHAFATSSAPHVESIYAAAFGHADLRIQSRSMLLVDRHKTPKTQKDNLLKTVYAMRDAVAGNFTIQQLVYNTRDAALLLSVSLFSNTVSYLQQLGCPGCFHRHDCTVNCTIDR